MNKIFNYITVALLIFAASSCEKADYTMSSSIKHVAFDGSKAIIAENSTDTLRIPIYLSTTDASLKTTVSFEISNLEGGIPAVEGEDYKILNKDNFQLNGTDIFNSLEVVTFDNDKTEGDKNFVLTISGSSTEGVSLGIGGEEDKTFVVNIIDDEHPLAHLFGAYNVKGNSLRYNEDRDWNATFLSVLGSTTQLDIQGLWDGQEYNLIRAEVDLENNKFTIPAGQTIAIHPDYGNVYVMRVEIIDGEKVVYPDEGIEGTINADGTISISDYGYYVSSAAATGFFDWFGTSTFTKK